MDSVIKKAYEASQKGQSFAFATIVQSSIKGTPRKPGSKMIVFADGSIAGTIGGGANEKDVVLKCGKAIRTLKPKLMTYKNYGESEQTICGGEFDIFIEPFGGLRHLIICGAGHIALPLSVIAKMLNFKVTIIDNRKEMANIKRFPHVDEIITGNHAKKLAKQKITKNSYIMIATQEHKYDYACLEAITESEATYIAVIASRTKREKFLKDLAKQGVQKKRLKNIKIPAGIDIGSQTPEEIALAVAAEIVSVYNKDWLKTSKFKAKEKK